MGVEIGSQSGLLSSFEGVSWPYISKRIVHTPPTDNPCFQNNDLFILNLLQKNLRHLKDKDTNNTQQEKKGEENQV